MDENSWKGLLASALSGPPRAERRKRLEALKQAPLSTLERDILTPGDFRALPPTLIPDALALLEAAP